MFNFFLMRPRASRAYPWLFALVLVAGSFAWSSPAQAKGGQTPAQKEAAQEAKAAADAAKKAAQALAKVAKVEVPLIEKLIDGKTRIIQRALVAEAQTTDTFTLGFAAEIATAETTQTAALQTFLLSWYQITFVPQLHDAHGNDDANDDVNEDFLDQASGFLHSEVAILDQILRKAMHPDLLTFATATNAFDQAALDVLNAHVQQEPEAGDQNDDHGNDGANHDVNDDHGNDAGSSGGDSGSHGGGRGRH